MSYNEADTRAKLIDPALHAKGWTEDHIKREVSAGAIEITGKKAKRQKRGRVDYTLRLRVNSESQPIAVALIEAKKEALSPGFGLEQGKRYAETKCNNLNIKFVYSSNGHMFVEYDRFTGLISNPKPMSEFPTTEELRIRYEKGMGFNLADEKAKPLLTKYTGGEAARRYYQDAAIRAAFEKIAQGGNRVLLSLATGAGKTFIAVNLLKRISDAGQLRKALFVCDRDELRTQGYKAFQDKFGSNAAIAIAGNPQHNARVIIVTYQTLGVSTDEDDPSFLVENYPENYFSHIVIDECHRSAWGKWSEVLKRNPNAIQIGLTATPRQIKVPDGVIISPEDARIAADNIKYFGEAVYEYTYQQAVEDGYLAACVIQPGNVNIDDTGLTIDEIMALKPRHAITGKLMTRDELQEIYTSHDFERKIMLPDRVQIMCRNLFNYLIETGSPLQKTIIFCVRESHASAVAIAMNNLYIDWCNKHGIEQSKRATHYAFNCTYREGKDYVADMKGSTKDYFIATTVDLLSTGVDIPPLRNIAFFRYMESPITVMQMFGRGTRLFEDKLMFTIYDYTDATRLLGEEFISKPKSAGGTSLPGDTGGDSEDNGNESGDGGKIPDIITADGVECYITNGVKYIVTEIDGKIVRIPLEEYKEAIAQRLVDNYDTIDSFRTAWINPSARQELINDLVHSGYGPEVVRTVEDMQAFDIYDVLAELAYGSEPKTRSARVSGFKYKNRAWLSQFSADVVEVILAIVSEFESDGTKALENPQIFRTKKVMEAGGLHVLKTVGKPNEIIAEAKRRIFVA